MTLDKEATELLESSKYSNDDTVCQYIGQEGRRIIVYVLREGGYISYYETGEGLNLWVVTVNMPGHTKDEYALAQSRVIRLLPSGHKVTPGETITDDGIRNWHKQILRDYEYADEFCYPYKIPSATEEDEPARIKLPILKYKK